MRGSKNKISRSKLNIKINPDVETLIDMPSGRSQPKISQREKELTNALSSKKFNETHSSFITNSREKIKESARTTFKPSYRRKVNRRTEGNFYRPKFTYKKQKKQGKILRNRPKKSLSLPRKLSTADNCKKDLRRKSHFFGKAELKKTDFVTRKERFFMRYKSERDKLRKKPKLKILNLNSYVELDVMGKKNMIHSPAMFFDRDNSDQQEQRTSENMSNRYIKGNFTVPGRAKKSKLAPLSDKQSSIFYNLTHKKFLKNSRNPFFIGPVKRLAIQIEDEVNKKKQKRPSNNSWGSKIFAKRVIFDQSYTRCHGKGRKKKFGRVKDTRKGLFENFSDLKKKFPSDPVTESTANRNGYFFFKKGGELSRTLEIAKKKFTREKMF